MLSPGQYHKRIPKSLANNLLSRRMVIEAAQNNRDLQKGLMEACKRDFFLWLNLFVYQYNPRRDQKVGPFISWPFQDDGFTTIFDCIENEKDLCIEKSREMGASWMCVLAMLWLALFHPWMKFLLISRSAEAVDRPEDADSLFWKFDFVLKNLPDWMKEGVKRRKMGLRFTRTNATVTGQASTGKAGVGGRATAIFVDEFSQIREDFQILGRTADTSGCRIFNFTHTDINNAAFSLTERPDMRKLVMHWSSHPYKNQGLYRYNQETNQREYLRYNDVTRKIEVTKAIFAYEPDFRFVEDGRPTGGPFPGIRSPWYDAECIRRKIERDIAMDLDINARGATSQFFSSATINQLKQNCTDPVWEGEIHYDKDTGRFLGLVPMENGRLKLWIRPTAEGRVPISLYVLGWDLSAGGGATPSCGTVFDARVGKKVASYVNPFITPEKLAPLAMAMCQLFKGMDNDGALIGWENPGPGLTFGRALIGLGYRNLWYNGNIRKVVQIGNPDIPGWYASPDAKLDLLTQYRYALEIRDFDNPDKLALDETLSFRYIKNGYVAHGGEENREDPSGAMVNHGDRVIADAIAWMLAKGKGKRETMVLATEPTVDSFEGRRLVHRRRHNAEEFWS